MRRLLSLLRFFRACHQTMIRSSRSAASSGWRIAGLLPLLALHVAAQSVHWDPPGGQLGFNQVSQISLVFENCEPDGAPALPAVDGLVFGRPSQSSQTSIVNFTMTRTFSLVYPVRPARKTSLTIPAFEVKTDKGNLRVAAATYGVGDATVGGTGVAIDDIASAKISVPRSTFWSGEVFPVTYTLDVARRYYHSLATNVEWPAAPFVAEEWSKPEPTEAMIGGERRVVSIQTTRAYSKQSGNLTLSPASQMVNLVVGSTGFGLFSQPNVEQRQLDSTPVAVTIKPLPPAPADFSGAVGDFTFVSKVVPTTTAVGEPVTWTIELSGTGNWPDLAGLPSRDVSNDFQVVQPKSKRTMKDGSIFEGTLSEDVVLVPSKAGSYRLAPVRFTYFDTKSGTYKTVSSEPVTVAVNAVSQPVQPPANSGAPLQFSINPPPAAAPTVATPAAAPPVAPENLPRDPLPPAARGIVPFTPGSFWTAVTVPALALVLLVWVVLAALQSRLTDPQRFRRAALAEVSTALAELRTGVAPANALRRWQRHTAALWEIPHAAPGAALVGASVDRNQPGQGPAWAALWTESDRAIHSRAATLAADWVTRAEAAAAAVRVPGWQPFALFAPRNLAPFFVAIILATTLLPVAAAADAGRDAYDAGNFTTAETEWRKSLQSSPRDWVARHNLGLALAQQDRWAEAAGYWTGAFLLSPRTESSRWELSLGLQRASLAPTDLLELSRGEGAFKLARLASPGEWQFAIVIATLLLAAALIALLLQGYRRIGVWAAPAALVAGLLAAVVAASATLALHRYGPLAHPQAAMVWKGSVLRSVPTEADTTQKTSPLSAGSVAVVEKTFLGWSKLAFSGGQSGWVRTEDLIPLYR